MRHRFSFLLTPCALAALALAGCWSSPAPPPPNNGMVTPVHGLGWFKQVQPDMRNAIAVIDGHETVVFWDDQTTFVRNGQPMRLVTKYWQAVDRNAAPTDAGKQAYLKEQQVIQEIIVPKTGESFEFRGILSRGEISLTVVQFR